MPKKRHQTKYSKPQSTPPPSLASTSSAASKNTQPRTVNSLLASLRTSHVPATPQHEVGTQQQPETAQAASMPPLIRQILHIPDSAPPRPRRLPRIGQDGRRLPPGPPPPASWVGSVGGRRGGRGPFPAGPDPDPLSSSLSRFQLTTTEAGHHAHYSSLFPRLPGTHKLAPGSLVDIVLRKMAYTWSFQRSFNRYYLYSLPGSLRSGLIATLCRHYVGGVTLADLRALLTIPDFPPDQGEGEALEVELEEQRAVNDDFHELDLSGCLGRTITLRELTVFLFGSTGGGSDSGSSGDNGKGKGKGKGKVTEITEEIQESWETYSSSPSPAPSLNCTLPYLTHLSLALPPTATSEEPKRYNISWKHLLSLASKLPSLTHLSLANWPTPNLTTGYVPTSLPFIPSSDSNPSQKADLAEAVLVLRKLSKSLYGLQYLDVSGCSEWWEVLRQSIEPSMGDLPDPEPTHASAVGSRSVLAERGVPPPNTPLEDSGIYDAEDNGMIRDEVDWVGDWGKVETVVMKSGLSPNPLSVGDTLQFGVAINSARSVERFVRGRRQGRGRWFEVKRDPFPDWWSEIPNREWWRV